MLRESYTAVVERNTLWAGAFASEPYECAWSSEAVIFARTLEGTPGGRPVTARVQMSPDGIHWVDEGTEIALPGDPGLAFCRVSHYGSWLRIAGATPEGQELRVLIYVCLKS